MTGWMIDRYGWGVWYPIMASFGAIGGLAMLMVMRKQRRMHSSGDARVVAR
jgi:sugar phosphate permease